MKSILLWAFLGIALAQQAPPGDIYVSGGGTAENPLRAFINLYQVGTEMTGDPGTDYDPKNNPDFPYPSDIQATRARITIPRTTPIFHIPRTSRRSGSVPWL